MVNKIFMHQGSQNLHAAALHVQGMKDCCCYKTVRKGCGPFMLLAQVVSQH